MGTIYNPKILAATRVSHSKFLEVRLNFDKILRYGFGAREYFPDTVCLYIPLPNIQEAFCWYRHIAKLNPLEFWRDHIQKLWSVQENRRSIIYYLVSRLLIILLRVCLCLVQVVLVPGFCQRLGWCKKRG